MKLVIKFFLVAFITSLIAPAASAQTPITPVGTITTTTTISPDATMVAMQQVMATQQVQIDELQRDLAFEAKNIDRWLTFFIGAVTIVLAILGIAGTQLYLGINNKILKRIRILINKYYYQLDIGNVELHIKERLTYLEKLLKSQGIYKVKRFSALGALSLRGVTVFPVDKNEEEQEYFQFIQHYYIKHKRLDPKKAGFILYASKGYRLNPDTIDLYPSTAVANTPWNLMSTIMILGRSIVTYTPDEITNAE